MQKKKNQVSGGEIGKPFPKERSLAPGKVVEVKAIFHWEVEGKPSFMSPRQRSRKLVSKEGLEAKASANGRGT